MNDKKSIWVPMEDGMVRDTTTDEIFPAGDQVADLKYEDKRGRRRTTKATRAELLEVVEARSGQLARVRIGKCTLLTPVLGPWHLAGDLSPPIEPSQRSPWPAVSGS